MDGYYMDSYCLLFLDAVTGWMVIVWVVTGYWLLYGWKDGNCMDGYWMDGYWLLVTGYWVGP